jgi:hypothetical protein
MHVRQSGGTVPAMPHWVLTIAICTVLWILGTVVIALGARWLVRQPD